jgi:hypothetical protein
MESEMEDHIAVFHGIGISALWLAQAGEAIKQ